MQDSGTANGNGAPHRRLDIEVVPQGGCVTVAPHGEIDMGTAEVLRERLDAASSGCERLLLDLRGVTFIDSSGLRLILERVRDEPERFAVIPGSREVQRIFELTGLLGTIPFAADAAEAA